MTVSERALLNTGMSEINRNEEEWTGMDRNGSEWDRNGPEWYRNEPEWTEMNRNEAEWTGMNRNEAEWTGTRRNEVEWTGMNRNEPEWSGIDRNNTEMDRNELEWTGITPGWTEMGQNENRSTKMGGHIRLECSCILTVRELNWGHPTSITGRVLNKRIPVEIIHQWTTSTTVSYESLVFTAKCNVHLITVKAIKCLRTQHR